MTIKNVIENDFCNGCGGCKLHSPDAINIKFTDSGFYKANIKQSDTIDIKISSVCPFSSDAKDESILGNALFNKNNNKYDEKVGFYSNIYAGNVKDISSRLSSSSGGITTWIAKKLLEMKKVDAIIHVGFDNGIFSYRVSKNNDELDNIKNKKSRYYPVTLGSICDYLSNTEDRIAIIGIPCTIKSIRLLQEQHMLTNIKYCLSLLCGHMKSSGFGESLAWQVGIPPKMLKYTDFRVKKEGFEASQYFFRAEDINGNIKEELNSDLLGSNWGLGFFRHNSCNFCDDIAGETADITLGDAWLPEYTKDYLGSNILIVRNNEIDSIIKEYSNELDIQTVDVDTFYRTQRGNYGNRRGGIIANQTAQYNWTPKKRLDLCFQYTGDQHKQRIYKYRAKLSRLSIEKFLYAKKINSFLAFKLMMMPYLVKYAYLTSGISGALLICIPKKIKKIIRKLR